MVIILGYKPAIETFIKYKAWSISTEEERAQIIGDWRNASIEKKVVDKRFMYLTDERYSGKKVYRVVFRAKNQGLLGPFGVYVDPLTTRIIGCDYRE